MVGGTANMTRLALVRNRHLGAYVLEYQIGCYSYTNLHPEQRESPGKFISAPIFTSCADLREFNLRAY